MKIFKITALATGLFVTANGFAQPKIVLIKGQKFNVESSVNMTSNAEVMGQSLTTTADSKTSTAYEVTGVEVSGIALAATISKMSVNASSMGQEMAFNSEDKNSSGPIADILSPKINKARSIQIDNKGTIVKEDEVADAGQLAMMGLSNGRSNNTDLFIPALIGLVAKTGDKIPAINDVKKEKYNSHDSGTYVITAIDNGIASLSYTGTQTIAETIEQMGMGMEMQTTHNNVVKSELQVELATGLVLLKATVTEMNISIEAGGMTIPATGKTITTTKVTPVQ